MAEETWKCPTCARSFPVTERVCPTCKVTQVRKRPVAEEPAQFIADAIERVAQVRPRALEFQIAG